MSTAEIGVIGGSGFYSLFSEAEELTVSTEFGSPSAPVTIGKLGGRAVAFLPRHGAHHEFPPHRVPYRANIAALRDLGVERIFAPCATGSLRRDLRPGEIVICDQLVDLTTGRERTFFDDEVRHTSFADPYCPDLRAAAISAGAGVAPTVHEVGTVVTIPGPRFSTRAESAWYRAMGWDLVNMTQCPEAALARELGICYCAIALVTDYDTGVDGVDGPAVTAEAVFAILASMVETAADLVAQAVNELHPVRRCACGPS